MSGAYVTLLYWLSIWTLVLWIIGLLRGGILHTTWGKVLFVPGVIADAAIRLVSCWLTGTAVKRFGSFADGRSFFEAAATPNPMIRRPIAVALRLWGVYFIVGTIPLIYPELATSAPALAEWDEAGPDLVSLAAFRHTGGHIVTLLGSASPAALVELLFLYGVASLTLAAALERKEILAAASAWLPLLAFFWMIEFLGVSFARYSNGWFLHWWYGPYLWSAFSLLVVMAVGVAALICIVRLTAALRRSMRTSGKK